jgi:hypothetical protein
MNRPLLWVTTAALGAVATVTSSFGLVAMLLAVLLAIPLVIRGGVVALSGLLTGFGALWSFLMARQFASGATTDNDDFWIAVGVLPLVLGCALLLTIAARITRARTATGR